jgi:hopene-associated glycosyltransferase HpnB
MVRLHCRSVPEKALIPAFVFFFLKLYPPRWIADPAKRTAGAAGGCILMRPAALDRIGRFAAIHGEIIDDCALAGQVKETGGRIWMGLTSVTRSVREYHDLTEIWNMIARTAFSQLRHSPTLLVATTIGMTLLYVTPVAAVLTRDYITATIGAAAWVGMAIAYAPAVRFYRLPFLWSITLPLSAIFYAGATISSAVRYWDGRGGQWKGRLQ